MELLSEAAWGPVWGLKGHRNWASWSWPIVPASGIPGEGAVAP